MFTIQYIGPSIAKSCNSAQVLLKMFSSLFFPFFFIFNTNSIASLAPNKQTGKHFETAWTITMSPRLFIRRFGYPKLVYEFLSDKFCFHLKCICMRRRTTVFPQRCFLGLNVRHSIIEYFYGNRAMAKRTKSLSSLSFKSNCWPSFH